MMEFERRRPAQASAWHRAATHARHIGCSRTAAPSPSSTPPPASAATPKTPTTSPSSRPPAANANGHYFGGNLYVLDGISTTSNITTGTANISPNADSLQEIAL